MGVAFPGWLQLMRDAKTFGHNLVNLAWEQLKTETLGMDLGTITGVARAASPACAAREEFKINGQGVRSMTESLHTTDALAITIKSLRRLRFVRTIPRRKRAL